MNERLGWLLLQHLYSVQVENEVGIHIDTKQLGQQENESGASQNSQGPSEIGIQPGDQCKGQGYMDGVHGNRNLSLPGNGSSFVGKPDLLRHCGQAIFVSALDLLNGESPGP